MMTSYHRRIRIVPQDVAVDRPGQDRLRQRSAGLLHVPRRHKPRRQTDRPRRSAGQRRLQRSARQDLRLPGPARRVRAGPPPLPPPATDAPVPARLGTAACRHARVSASRNARQFQGRQHTALVGPHRRLSGFVFINNYQRGQSMPAKPDVQFQVQLPSGPADVPRPSPSPSLPTALFSGPSRWTWAARH